MMVAIEPANGKLRPRMDCIGLKVRAQHLCKGLAVSWNCKPLGILNIDSTETAIEELNVTRFSEFRAFSRCFRRSSDNTTHYLRKHES
jgi:hypothetical protein